MKLLISVIDEEEAKEAVAGGADIVDVKNPEEGSLGANFPRVIKRVRATTPPWIEVSAAIGDMPNLPGTASLAALGAAVCNVNYVKVGVYGPRTESDAEKMLREVSRAVKEYSSSIKTVAVAYADFKEMDLIDPFRLLKIAYKAGMDGVMIDTKSKDGRKIFNFLSIQSLKSFIENAHELGLITAVAGSLGKEDMPAVCKVKADVVGVRGSVCIGRDRVRGRVSRELVSDLLRSLRLASSRDTSLVNHPSLFSE